MVESIKELPINQTRPDVIKAIIKEIDINKEEMNEIYI
jgi:hypothetical protein